MSLMTLMLIQFPVREKYAEPKSLRWTAGLRRTQCIRWQALHHLHFGGRTGLDVAIRVCNRPLN
jgi:hypothetical protein